MKETKDIVDEINQLAGKDIAIWGDHDSVDKVDPLPTGILPLDWAIGIGGLPKGRIVEIKGLPSTGKSSLCLGIIKNAQKSGIQCAYIDAEFALDMDFAEKLGVKVEDLAIIRPDCGEEAFTAIDKLLRDKSVGLIIVDSISGLVPRGDIEAEVGKYMIGSQARMVSMELRKIVGPLSKSGAVIIFINQYRMNILGGQYDPYTTPGGMSLRFYTSVSLEIKRDGIVKQGDEPIGYSALINIKKNKVGRPNGKCNVTFLFDEGFSASADIIDMGEKSGVILREGNSYFYGKDKLGVSLNKTRDYLKENPVIADEILQKIKAVSA